MNRNDFIFSEMKVFLRNSLLYDNHTFLVIDARMITIEYSELM